jgi:hypothetical protein
MKTATILGIIIGAHNVGGDPVLDSMVARKTSSYLS